MIRSLVIHGVLLAGFVLTAPTVSAQKTEAALEDLPVESQSALDNTTDASLRNRVEVLNQLSEILGERVHAIASVRRFYEANGFTRVWTTPGGITAAADSGLAFLDGARDHGLTPDHYHRAMLTAPALRSQPIQFEILMTDAILLYAAHLIGGKVDPVAIDPDWHAVRPEGDVVGPLLTAIAGNDLRSLERTLGPKDAPYHALRRQLARYRGFVEPWYAIPEGPIRKPGESDARIPAIRKRVTAYARFDSRVPAIPVSVEGAPDREANELYDDALATGIRAFQQVHGLGVDGAIGPATIEALNRTPLERLQQIRVNLERWRWLPRAFGERHILVNIAGYNLVYREGSTDSLEMRVIVGRDYRKTPVFIDSVSYLVLNPTWEVPRSILVQDILPLAKKDPTYLENGQFEILSGWGAGAERIDPGSIDWSGNVAARFPYRLQQKPGPKNALGRVKFMFPNPYNVYLHDTSSPALFDKPDRALSSGCIRVARPMELIERLLRGDRNWPMSRVDQVLKTRTETTVRLTRKVPVYMVYLTAWCDEQGGIQFRRDIYTRDAGVLAALDEAPPMAARP